MLLVMAGRSRSSGCTTENSRYSLTANPKPDHPNDDRYFVCTDSSSRFDGFGIFDGHDGSNASDFACRYVESLLLRERFPAHCRKNGTEITLETIFCQTERNFFKSINQYIKERKKISQKLKVSTLHA